MRLVQLKCPSCGAVLDNANNDKKIKCEYCGVVTVIDDEVITVNHHIKDDSLDLKFDNAEAYLNKLEDYDIAYDLYSELAIARPLDKRVWYGLLISITKNFSYFPKNDFDLLLEEVEKYFNNYQKMESDQVISERIEKYYDEYIKRVKRSKFINSPLFIIMFPVIVVIVSIIISYIAYSANIN